MPASPPDLIGVAGRTYLVTWAQRPEEELLARLVGAHIPPGATADALLAAHEEVLRGLWEQLTPLVGNLGARTIFGRAIRVASRREPLLGQCKATEAGLELGPLRAEAMRLEHAAASQAVETLSKTVVEVVHELLGPGLLLALLDDVSVMLDEQTEYGSNGPPRER